MQWTKNVWDICDATAKCDDEFPALKYRVNIFYPPTAKSMDKQSQQRGSACPSLLLNHPHLVAQTNTATKSKSPNQQKLVSIYMGYLCSHSFGMKLSSSTRPYNYIKVGLQVWERPCAAITMNVTVRLRQCSPGSKYRHVDQ